MAASPPWNANYLTSIQPFDNIERVQNMDPPNAMAVPRHYIEHPTAHLLEDRALWFTCKESRRAMKRVYRHWENTMMTPVSASSEHGSEANDETENGVNDETEEEVNDETEDEGGDDASDEDTGPPTIPTGGNGMLVATKITDEETTRYEDMAYFNDNWREVKEVVNTSAAKVSRGTLQSDVVELFQKVKEAAEKM